MSHNPALVEALVRDRVADLRHSAHTSALGRRAKRRRGVIESARRGSGWLLVDMGLRLALPRSKVNHHWRAGSANG